jgi:hypothetical protein
MLRGPGLHVGCHPIRPLGQHLIRDVRRDVHDGEDPVEPLVRHPVAEDVRHVAEEDAAGLAVPEQPSEHLLVKEHLGLLTARPGERQPVAAPAVPRRAVAIGAAGGNLYAMVADLERGPVPGPDRVGRVTGRAVISPGPLDRSLLHRRVLRAGECGRSRPFISPWVPPPTRAARPVAHTAPRRGTRCGPVRPSGSWPAGATGTRPCGSSSRPSTTRRTPHGPGSGPAASRRPPGPPVRVRPAGRPALRVAGAAPELAVEPVGVTESDRVPEHHRGAAAGARHGSPPDSRSRASAQRNVRSPG